MHAKLKDWTSMLHMRTKLKDWTSIARACKVERLHNNIACFKNYQSTVKTNSERIARFDCTIKTLMKALLDFSGKIHSADSKRVNA